MGQQGKTPDGIGARHHGRCGIHNCRCALGRRVPASVQGLADVAQGFHVVDELAETQAAQLAIRVLSGGIGARDFGEPGRFEGRAHPWVKPHAAQHRRRSTEPENVSLVSG